jgi:inositol oxygenase
MMASVEQLTTGNGPSPLSPTLSTGEESTNLVEDKTKFRVYAGDESVRAFYKKHNIEQTVAQTDALWDKFLGPSHTPVGSMGIFEALTFLDTIVDQSDPDLHLPQTVHCYQTAERCRAQRPDDDWYHLVGLIHDLGKILSAPSINLDQIFVVGDSFPVGAAFSDKIVWNQFFAENPDTKDERYNTKLGIYSEGCGFDKLKFSFGHDEYLYQILKRHPGCTIPEEGLYFIRFHSFYSWHHEGAYAYFANETDHNWLPRLQKFQRSDLYSKSDEENKMPDIAALAPYYKSLVEKYIPGTIVW